MFDTYTFIKKYIYNAKIMNYHNEFKTSITVRNKPQSYTILWYMSTGITIGSNYIMNPRKSTDQKATIYLIFFYRNIAVLCILLFIFFTFLMNLINMYLSVIIFFINYSL